MEKARLLILCCETLPSFRPPTTQKWIRQFLIETEEKKKDRSFFSATVRKVAKNIPNFEVDTLFPTFFMFAVLHLLCMFVFCKLQDI